MIGAWVQGLWSQSDAETWNGRTEQPTTVAAEAAAEASDAGGELPVEEGLLPPEERARIEAACAIAEFELHSLIGERNAPAAVVDFLRRDWLNHLTLIVVAEGEDSAAYRKAAAAGVTLWLAMQACERGADAPSGILQLLQPAFDAFGRSAEEAQAIGDAIIEAMRALRPETAAEAPADSHASTPNAEEEGVDIAGWLQGLEVGAWFTFTDEAGRSQPAKLSWISPISNKMLLVDEHGARLGAFSADELAALARVERLAMLDPARAPVRPSSPRAGLPAANGVLGAVLRRAMG